MDVQATNRSQSRSRVKKSPSWKLHSKAGRHHWNALWYVDPRGYEWTWDLKVNYGYRLPYKPELNCISGTPTTNDGDSLDTRGPWLVAGTKRRLEARADSGYYDPLSWGYLKEPDLPERSRPRLHRRFAEIGTDPGRILAFASRFGQLGERGVMTDSPHHTGYAESYSVWCQEAVLMRRLCTWWDLVRERTPAAERKLREWFDPKGGRMDYVKREAWEEEIPDLYAKRLNDMHATDERLSETQTLAISAPYALQAGAKLTVKEPVLAETRKRYEQMGWPCPEHWVVADPNPDIFAVAALTINEIVNNQLALTTRVAVQFDLQGHPDQAYYMVVETLLGAIYRSFIGEVLRQFLPEKTCPWCERPFVPTRSDQIYCCDIHRINFSQRERRAAAKASKAS